MRLVCALVFLSMPLQGWAADCATDLKPTDTYKELSARLKCLNDRISAIEKAGSSLTNADPRRTAVAGTQTQEVSGVKVDLESCAKAGSNLKCRAFITSASKDRYIWFLKGSNALDENGNVYSWFGQEGTDKSLHQGGYQVKFLADARTVGWIYFELPDKPGKVIDEMQLHLSWDKDVVLHFNNIQISN